MEKPRLGFIGLGLMGRALAEQLAAAGYPLTVWNLEPERMAGFHRTAGSPAEVAAHSDIVLLCVTDTAAVESVIFGPNGVAAAGRGATIVVDHSTAMPLPTAEMARRLKAATGADWVDAPVSGGPAFAREKRLTIMAGGEPTAFATVRPVLETYATNITLMGPPGAGQATKVLNQAVSGVSYVLMAEVLRLAEASGIDGALVPAALRGGHADSTMLNFAYPRMLARDFDPPASFAANVLKDLKHVTEEADRFGLSLPLIAAAVARFEAFVAAGGGGKDTSAILEMYED